MANTPTYDVESYDIVTAALMDLLNEYPALDSGDSIKFGVLNENSGKAMFPTSGAIVQRERRDILGNVEQTCSYPFLVIYRAGQLTSVRKQNAQEWLDQLGRWLEKQAITVSNTEYQIDEYPTLSDNRKFLQIRRTAPAVLNSIQDNNAEDWAISITATYQNKIYKF